MSNPPEAAPGTRIKIGLRDMVEPWLNCVIYIHFDNGTKAKAKIIAVDDEQAEVIVLAKTAGS